MQLNEKLRALRLKCNMTQESVAEQLGISSQTVSKWERGLLSPDIMLLPKLALLYRCSIDSLFDMESCWNQEHTQQFHDTIRALHRAKDYEGIYRAWIREIELSPDNFANYIEVMQLVNRQKMNDDTHIGRMLLLADRAEKYCSDDDIRNEIHRLMLQICSRSENEEIRVKAKKYYEKLPMLRHSREVYAQFIMTEDEYRSQMKYNIMYTVDLAECAIRQLIKPEMLPTEKLFYYKKAAALYEVILDGKYGGFFDVPLLFDYVEIAILLMQLDRREEALDYVRRILSALEKHLSDAARSDVSVFVYSTAPHNYTPAEISCKKLLRKLTDSPELESFRDEIASFAKRFNERFA